ncbi:hypothetical protein BOTNAR_0099g00210 [Botryotinia narcissicola]|uniref:Thioester reductase (TE) domain-containing protein n=1 Tax=Botryotinia narcissicola TaxID=278944 RepID=A0A4Z1IS21_9HELO|nr:hypothetical protein BOTNAR_0099g00210 [Botryotinia narcissicola]
MEYQPEDVSKVLDPTLGPANNYLEDLIQTYSINFPFKKAKTIIKSHDDGLQVILTGSTGYLGYYFLKALIADSKVARIICFNRSEAEKDFVAEFGNLDDAQKFQFVKASFDEPRFGLEPAIHQSFLESIDVILHNAWAVDFNLPIESFEKVHIVGVRNCIDWSLLSPRKVTIQFMSSLGSLASWPSFRPKTPVSEQAAEIHGISVDVLRCGQIGGPAVDGKKQWDAWDWFPILLQTSKALELVPSDLGSQDLVQWIPADIVTQIIVELMHGSDMREGLTTFNLVNPRFAKWSDLVPGVKQLLGVAKEVSLELKKHDATSKYELQNFPALKLLGFLEWLTNEERLVMITENAQAASPSFRDLSPIDDEMI